MQTIDAHAHLTIPKITQEFPDGSWRQDIVPKAGVLTLRKYRGLSPRGTIDVDMLLEDMKDMHTDRMVLSPAPSLFFYEETPELGLRAAQIQNDGMAKLANDYPDRFSGLAVLPLQDVQLAIREMRRAVKELDLRGVAIGSSVQGLHMGNPVFNPFWEAVAEMDLFAFIHPAFVKNYEIKTLAAYHLNNLFGNPMETGLAAADLVFSGVLERHPGLKILLAHGGGVMPWLKGRWVDGYEMRPEPKAYLKRSPLESINKFYIDTIIHDPRALKFLVESFGADHVLLGSDFPAAMGPEHPVREVEALNISNEDKANILGKNAARLMKLKIA